VEVRFEDLRVTAYAESAGRTLPSIWNSYRNAVEVKPLPGELNPLLLKPACRLAHASCSQRSH
jgi:hypothetical protein